MIFLCRKYYLLEKKMNESVLWQDNTFNQVLVLKKHFWVGKQHNFSTEIKMGDIDEKIEKLRAAMRQNCINLSRATDDKVKSAIMDNINNIWVEIHMLKERKSSTKTRFANPMPYAAATTTTTSLITCDLGEIKMWTI